MKYYFISLKNFVYTQKNTRFTVAFRLSCIQVFFFLEVPFHQNYTDVYLSFFTKNIAFFPLSKFGYCNFRVCVL